MNKGHTLFYFVFCKHTNSRYAAWCLTLQGDIFGTILPTLLINIV